MEMYSTVWDVKWRRCEGHGARSKYWSIFQVHGVGIFGGDVQYGECNGGDVRGMERGVIIVGYVRGVYV